MLPGDMPDHELAIAGFVPGMPGVVIGPVDKPDRFTPRVNQPDDIWEEPDGIRSKYQASTLLMTEPLLWGPFIDWRLSGHELSRIELSEMSNFEVDVVYALAGAKQRKLFPKKRDGK